MKNIKIGLVGFGVVGQGFYNILQTNTSFDISFSKICVKQKGKRRPLPLEQFTFDKNELLNDDSIDVIIEVIDDAKEAFLIVSEALRKGKNVVTSNKKMLAENLLAIQQIQKETGKTVLYEGSACASIPILRTLEEYYDNDFLNRVGGIFNVSTNYILTKIFKENKDFDIALKQAQDLGYAESDPTLDVIGYDGLYKLIVVTLHAYGLAIDPKDVVVHGIQYLSRHDIQYAKERGALVRHIATVTKKDDQVILYVLPQFIYSDNELYDVDHEYNAIQVDAAFCGKQFYKGIGAGGNATGFAIFSDLSALAYDYKYEYKKQKNDRKLTHSNNEIIEVYFRYYDEKNLNAFNFEHISARYTSDTHGYVIGQIKLEELLRNIKLLNTADIFVATTGK